MVQPPTCPCICPPLVHVSRLVKNPHGRRGLGSSTSFGWPARPTPVHPWQPLDGLVATWEAPRDRPGCIYVQMHMRPPLSACMSDPSLFWDTSIQAQRASLDSSAAATTTPSCVSHSSLPIAHGVRVRAHRLGWPSRARAPRLRVRPACTCVGVRRSGCRTVRHTPVFACWTAGSTHARARASTLRAAFDVVLSLCALRSLSLSLCASLL